MRLRRWLRRLSIALAIVALVLGVTIAIVRWRFSGENLGDTIEEGVNLGKDGVRPIRGRVEVDSVDWPLGAIFSLRHFPIRIDKARVFDPNGKKIMELWGVNATLDALKTIRPEWMGGLGDLDVESMIVDKGTCLVEEVPKANPTLEDPTEVGLVAAFGHKARLPAGAAIEKGPIFDIGHIELKAVDLFLHFRSWQADIYNLRTDNGTLKVSFREQLVDDINFNFSTIPLVGDSAKLTIGPLSFDLKNIQVSRFGIFPDSHTQMDYDLVADTAEGARLHARGALQSLWKAPGGVDLTLEVERAGALVARLSEGRLGGDDVQIHGRVHGTYEDPRIELSATAVEVKAVPDVPLTVRSLAVDLRLAADQATVKEAVIAGLGGEVKASGTFHLATRRFDARVDTIGAVDLAKFLPKDVARVFRGTTLSGSLTLAGTPDDLVITPENVRVGKARIARGAVTIKGPEVIYDVRVEFEQAASKSHVDLQGTINTKTRQYDAKVLVDIDPLGPLLDTLQAAPLLRWLAGRARVVGSYDTKTGRTEVRASRVNLLDTVDVKAIYDLKRQFLSIQRLTATPLGGKLTGSGRVRLAPTMRLDQVRIDASGMQLAKAQPLAGAMGGVGRLKVSADGNPKKKWLARVEAGVDGLSLGSMRLGDARAQVEIDEAGALIQQLHVGRPPQGTLDVTGRIGFNQTLDLTVDLRRYPLGTLPGLADSPGLGLSGEASMRARVGGTFTRPEVSGVAQLIQVAFRETILGGANIKLEPWPNGRVHFYGRLFQNKLSVDGFVTVNGPFEITARVAFRRLEVDEVLPELSRTIGANGWASGVGSVRIGADVSATLAITDLVFTVDGTDDNGRPRPLVVRNADKVDLEYAKGVARLKRPVTFQGPDGNFTLEGKVGQQTMDVSLEGQVRLSLLAFYTRRFVEESSGSAIVNVRLSGPPSKPVMQGTVQLKDAAVRRPRQETWIKLPTGRIVLANNLITVENLLLEVDRQTTKVDGSLTLTNFVPNRVRASIKGMLAARLVEVLFPTQVSASKGAARIDLALSGAFANPDIDGTLTFDRVFEIAPRGLRRDVALVAGKVRFTNKEIQLKDVRGTVDDVSPNLFLTGNPDACTTDGFCTAVRLYEWSLVDLFVRVDLTRFTHRIPGVLDVEVALTGMTLSGDLDGLQLRGNIDVIDGRYTQGFRIDEFLRPVRIDERTVPFWEDDPLLRTTLLYLQVDSNQGAFRIENNIASVPLSGGVTITGTPQKPRLGGSIAMDGGTIKLPLTRPRFQLRSGTVIFFEDRELPAETPEISLVAEDPEYQDLAGTSHTIILEINGTLGRLAFDLSTNTGLNKAQTLQLITLRRSDLDEFARGRAQQNVSFEDRQLGQTAFSSQDTFTSAADPLVKEAVSQYISILVEDPLRRALSLDCFRVVAGLESTGVYVCKDLIQNFRLEGDAELGLRGGDREKLGTKLQFTDDLSLDAYVERVNFDDERLETENKARGLLRFKFIVP